MRRPEARHLALIPILLLFACSLPPSQEEGSSPSDSFPTPSGPHQSQEKTTFPKGTPHSDRIHPLCSIRYRAG